MTAKYPHTVLGDQKRPFDAAFSGFEMLRETFGDPKEQEAMTKDVPEWAIERAEEMRADLLGKSLNPTLEAFARYIAAHEQPPVDWLAAIIEAAQDEGTCIAQALRQRIPNIDQHAPAATDGE